MGLVVSKVPEKPVYCITYMLGFRILVHGSLELLCSLRRDTVRRRVTEMDTKLPAPQIYPHNVQKGRKGPCWKAGYWWFCSGRPVRPTPNCYLAHYLEA
jgi:hypothetical protein